MHPAGENPAGLTLQRSEVMKDKTPTQDALEQVQRYSLVKTEGMFGNSTGNKRMVVSSIDGEWIRWDDAKQALQEAEK